ncbi:histidine kinase dimerization/phosphoacceptor domain -containing protein [Pedobacter sp. AW1-32]|uniref:histidine kinase dimerization/phosphoacceptor domain -containing protein n=1 Tax=Pedobacter sp. AW1-32 TaxID=3383026 RepID=UPI003FED4BBB
MNNSRQIQFFFRCAIICLLFNLSTKYGLRAQEIRSKPELDEALKKLAKIGNTERKASILLEIGGYYLNLQGENPTDLEQATNFQQQAFAVANRENLHTALVRSLILKGDILRESGRAADAEKEYNKAIQLAQQKNLKDNLAKALSAKGQLYNNEGAQLQRKIELNEQALSLYRQSSNQLEEANSLKNLGDYYMLKARPAYAIKLMDTALSVYKSIKFKELQGVYNNMAITYNELGNFSEALKYGLMAEKTADLVQDTSLQKSSIYNHIALTYYYLRDDKKALQYWRAARKLAERYHDAGYIQTVVANIASVLIRMKQFKEGIAELKDLAKNYPPTETQMKLRLPYLLFNTYYDIQEYDKAELYFKTLMKFHQELPDDDINQTYLYRSIIRKYTHDKNFALAEKYLLAHEKQATAQSNLLALWQLHRMWFTVDSGLNKPWAAIEHYKTFKRLSDSISNQDKVKQISRLEVQYQTEQKDKDIALLSQRNQIQRIRIQQDGTIRAFFIVGLSLAALFAALMYNRYRLKKRSNLILEEKQAEINAQNDLLKKILNEKEWLLREIHHRVKNNLQIVISLLNTQSAYLDNEDALVAIRNSQNRMHAMSLIHHKLYRSDNLAEIDMKWYIKELVDYMRECFDTDRKILFVLDVEAIKLDVAQAVPLGLILNEAISNAIKYAFPEDRKGKVSISFRFMQNEICELRIVDDGVGLPDGFEIENSESLGMSLMTGLTEQLNGHIRMWNAGGLILDVCFQKHEGLLLEEEGATALYNKI